MQTVILDTSFIVKCAEYHIDLFAEITRVCTDKTDLYYLDVVLRELEAVSRQGGKEREYAKLAKLFLTKMTPIAAGEGVVDDRMLEIASSIPGCMVATTDMGLKRRLKARKVPVIFIRQKRYVMMTNWLDQ